MIMQRHYERAQALKGNASTRSCVDAEVRTSVLLTYTQRQWGGVGVGVGAEGERFKKPLPCNEVKSANKLPPRV